jgi:glycosyltransferase involved in cell wall biosynthesis
MLSAVAASTVEIPRRVGTWQRAVDMFVVLDGRAVPELVAGGVPADKIAVRSNAARDPGPRPSPPSQSSEVVYAGRLSHEKGADLLLEAWRRAAPAGLNLVLYGDGALRAELERQRVEGVSFRGHVDRSELEKRLLGARALVFPSTCQEAADPPMAPLEAAAAGLPAIISSTVGFSNRAQSAGAGWSVPPDDVAAFAAALTSLHDDERIDEAGRAARAMYEQSFSDEAAYGSLVAVYERAISMRP